MDQLSEQGVLSLADIEGCVIDDPEEGRFDVARRIFEDPQLFELEMEYIFGRTWVYLAHESQLANPHDYFATRLGRHPVLLTRDGDGKVHGFINSCRHRGAKLTHDKRRGNKKTFLCPFHGWVYDSQGNNVDVRAQDVGAYPASFREESHDLLRLARLEEYGGFIFGSLSGEVDDLASHLGGATRIIDMMSKQSPDGMEVLKGEIRYSNNANWKLQLENIDGYHFFPTHLSYLGLLQKRIEAASDKKIKAVDARDMSTAPSGNYDLGNGHMLDWTILPNGDDRPLGMQRARVEAEHGKVMSRWMIDHVRNMLLYPNMLLMDQSSTTIRVVHPIAVDKTQIEVYCIAPRNEPVAARTRRLRQFEDFLGPAGMATPDDQNMFEICQRGLAGQKQGLLQGYVRGMSRITKGPDAAAREAGFNAVASGGHIDDETLIHGSYRQWLKLMREGFASA